MTKEEAIRLLDPKTTREAIAEIEYYGGFSGREAAIKAIEDACVLAVEALKLLILIGAHPDPAGEKGKQGVKIPVISMEDVPKIMEELPSVEENPILKAVKEMENNV